MNGIYFCDTVLFIEPFCNVFFASYVSIINLQITKLVTELCVHIRVNRRNYYTFRYTERQSCTQIHKNKYTGRNTDKDIDMKLCKNYNGLS